MKNFINVCLGVSIAIFVIGIFSVDTIDRDILIDAVTPEFVEAWGSSCGGCGDGDGDGDGDPGDPPGVTPGCTDPTALNYDPQADVDNGSCIYPAPSCDSFTASPNTFNNGTGGTVTLTWQTTNTSSITIDNGVGTFTQEDGSTDVNVTQSTTFNATVTDGSTTVSCPAAVVTVNTPNTTPGISIVKDDNDNNDDTQTVASGGTATFSIVVTNTGTEDLVNVVVTDPLEPNCNRTIGALAIGASDIYTCTSTNVTDGFTNVANVTADSAVDGETVNDTDPTDVVVTTTTAPGISIVKDDNDNNDDTQTVSSGGTATFSILVTNTGTEDLVNVVVTDALEPDCDTTIGNLAVGATHSYTCTSTNVTSDFTNVAVVTGESAVDGDQVTDNDPTDVVVSTNTTSTCNFLNASDTAIAPGESITLSWGTTNATDVSINGQVVPVNGTLTVSPSNDTTYVLTHDGQTTTGCQVHVDVKKGGSSGSSSPKCDLDISDEKITLGESITLTWNTNSKTKEIKLEDDHGNVIIESDDDDDLDGEITIKPTQDTEYTLTAIRSSKERKCRVEVEIENSVTVLETRSQEPRVAGISLTSVPYTGFEAGPMLTWIFYALLTLWALFVAYVVVLKRDGIGGVSFAGAHEHTTYSDQSTDAVEDTSAAEAYVAAATTAPSNLPVAPAPVVGYAAAQPEADVTETDENEFAALENAAHAHRVLLSSDAMRHLMSTAGSSEKAIELLNSVVPTAKATYPCEDGWVVLNLARIETLGTSVPVNEAATPVAAPANTGSLAEAILAGNIVAAYDMIDDRPMVALAAAAADLDAVYRVRAGESAVTSDLLTSLASSLTTDQIKAAISALTGALDGTYADEAEAVKMAILKATQAVA